MTPAEVLDARRMAASLSLKAAKRKLDAIIEARAPLAGRGDLVSRGVLEVVDVADTLLVAVTYALASLPEVTP